MREIGLGRTEFTISAMRFGDTPIQGLSKVELFHRERAKAGLD